MVEQKFPDGNDRTPNDPCVLLSAASIRRMYEAERGSVRDGAPAYTDDDVRNFITTKAKENNWDDVEFLNSQVLLKKKLLHTDYVPEVEITPLVRVIAEGNNGTGKTTVLEVIQRALKAHGFSDVVFVNPEENEENRARKYAMPVSGNPLLKDLRIELVEKFGRIQ